MKRVKVLYLVSNLRKTGPVLQLYNIVKYLDRNVFEPVILTISPEDQNSVLSDFVQLQVPVISLNWPKGSLPPKRIYFEKIKQISPTMLHSHGLRPDIIVKDLPSADYIRFTTIHCDPLEDYPRLYGSRGFFAALMHIRTLRRIENRVACSKSLAEQLMRKYGLKASYVLNSTDIKAKLENIIASEQSIAMPRKKDDFVFIYVGELIKRKNLSFLLEAFKALPNNIKLVVVGDGPERTKLESRAPSNVIFVGRQENVASFLMNSDGYVSASLSEGLPTAVLEALALGVPVLLSNIPAHAEILSLAEQSGFRVGSLFRTSDLKDLLQKIRAFTIQDYNKLEIVEFFEAFFSPEKMSIGYQSLYLSSITER